jgi:predicted DCC family thiol-disulfide oxidoreductase YuxK
VSPVSLEMAAALDRRTELPLTVLYDERCDLCRRLRDWLSRQPTLNPVEFVAAGSPAARARWPELDPERTTRILTVVASDGGVYEADRAWLLCAWALPKWRPVAEHVASPTRRRVVGAVGRLMDYYRHRRACGDDCASVHR